MKNTPAKRHPKIPFPSPSFLLALSILAAGSLIILLPLLTVWKQAYITNASLVQKQLADSVIALSQKTTQLRMSAQELSGNERIERLARQWLLLDYPTADRIVIVRPVETPAKRFFPGLKFFALLRKSLEQEKS
jgi:cell division protein FtsL